MKRPSEKKKTGIRSPIGDGGIATLFYTVEHDKKIARKLFSMATEERGTDEELRAMITRRTLQELIFLMIDLTKTARAVANQERSNQIAGLAKVKAQKLLYDWLDKNLHKYPRQLDACAYVAEIEIRGLGRGFDWIRPEITSYRKSRGLRKQTRTLLANPKNS
jgi:hypothetical protein